MKTITKAIIGVSAWAVIALIFAPTVISGCSCEKNRYDESVFEEGLIRNDDLVAVRNSDGKITIKSGLTGKVTIKDIQIDWTQESPHDSLAVFCSNGKRGYYNMFTGEVAVPAQYRRAWVFSEGLAAVQINGMIGFVDHKGNVIIDYNYPYHGNPLSEFLFKNGHCVVANNHGKCGVIDMTGKWIIEPEYDNISTFERYAIVSKSGIRMQVGYDGAVMNSFVLDDIDRLTYTVYERYVDRNGEIQYIDKEVDTGLFEYRVGGLCGLMDSNCQRITEPLYKSIRAVDKNMFRALLEDYYSEVIIDSKGVVMK